MNMSSCATPAANAPAISVTLAGSGEPLLRMEKRMTCAAAGLGIRLDMEIRKDSDSLDIPYLQTPAVLHEGEVIFNGLPRTEKIEAWLRNLV